MMQTVFMTAVIFNSYLIGIVAGKISEESIAAGFQTRSHPCADFSRSCKIDSAIHQNRIGADNMKKSHASLRNNQRGVSPAISTIILTAAVIAMILVVMSLRRIYLNSGMAQNEFNANKQFMQTTGQQMDDIAWTTGAPRRLPTQPSWLLKLYTPSALNYTLQLIQLQGKLILHCSNGILLYNMPVSSYSIGNNYFERVPIFCQQFLSAAWFFSAGKPSFCEEKLSMSMVATPE